MTSFKRWFGAGAIAVLVLALIACPAAVSPPTVVKPLGDMTLSAGGIETVRAISSYFGNVTSPEPVTATSSNTSVATVAVASDTLTVTAKADGDATVLVTAKGSNGEASQTFNVRVRTVVEVNHPPMQRTISNVSLMDGVTKMITLSDYYTDADGDTLTFTAMSSDSAVATVSEPDGMGMITITAVDPGTATITVTATDGTNDAVTQTFDVTVTATEPDPPSSERPIIRTLIEDIDSDFRIDDTRDIDLSESYKDPEGDTLMYTAMSSNTDVATVSEPDGMGMITITGVAVGSARITVSATDGHNDPVRQTFTVMVGSKPPAPVSGLPTSVSLHGVGDTEELNLSIYYDDPEDDTLMYTAMSDTPAVATVTDPDDMGMITITAAGVGSATITVTAADSDNDPVPQTFMVAVTVDNNLPTVKAGLMNMNLQDGGMETLDPSMYFMDSDEGDTLTYTAMSDDEDVATASAPDDMGMITITAAGVGSATITLTAMDSRGASVSQTFMVTVTAMPPANQPPVGTDISDVSLQVGATEDLTLSMYFTDPDEGDTLAYTAVSSATAVATVSTPDDMSMITITAVRVGGAMITVTANDGTNDAVSKMFDVTVTEAPNQAPRAKDGMMLPDLRIEIVDAGANEDTTTTPAKTGTDNDTRAADGPGDAADNKTIDLSKYFEDPDGPLLFFKVTKTETPDDSDNKPVIDLHSMKATASIAASGDPLDGTDVSADMVVIEPRNPGSATVTVTVTDIDGAATTDEFMVTVVASGTNEAPVIGHTDTDATGATGTTDSTSNEVFPDLTGAAGVDETDTVKTRLKIGATPRKVINDALIMSLFSDPDFAKPDRPNEMLTLSVKYFPLDIGTDEATRQAAAANPDTKELAADKVGVSAMPMTTTWNGSSSAKLTLSLTGEKPTPLGEDNTIETDDGHLVALIATDEYGESFAHVLQVIVNHAPKATGPQEKDAKTLGSETMCGTEECMDLGFNSVVAATDVANQRHLALVSADGTTGGYFHDPDGADSALTCRIKDSTATDGAFKFTLQASGAETADVRSLRITILKAQGTGSVTIACLDAYGESSGDATLRVRATHQSASLQ